MYSADKNLELNNAFSVDTWHIGLSMLSYITFISKAVGILHFYLHRWQYNVQLQILKYCMQIPRVHLLKLEQCTIVKEINSYLLYNV